MCVRCNEGGRIIFQKECREERMHTQEDNADFVAQNHLFESKCGPHWDMIVNCVPSAWRGKNWQNWRMCVNTLQHKYLQTKHQIISFPRIWHLHKCVHIYRSSHTPKVSFSILFKCRMSWDLQTVLLLLLTFFVQVCRLSIPSAIMNKSNTSSSSTTPFLYARKIVYLNWTHTCEAAECLSFIHSHAFLLRAYYAWSFCCTA